MKPSGNHYQVLGLSPSASAEDIRKAYLIYAAKFHPDKHDGDPFFEERFKEVKTAYESLSDLEKRWQYDIKTFGRSKVVIRTQRGDFIPDNSRAVRKRFALEIRHLDVYIASFYFINVNAWAVIRASGERASPGYYAWSLFFGSLSSFFFWLFINGWVEKNYNKSGLVRFYWILYFLLGLAMMGILVVAR